MKFFSVIASSVITGASFITGSTVQAFGQWPTRDFYSARAVAVSTRSAIPQFPASIPEFYRVPGRDFWNNPVSERGQVRTFGDGEWQSIHQFPNTMNGCNNGVFLLRWRSSNGPVLSAVGTSFSADFKASMPSAYGYLYGNNCQKPLFKSVRSSSINNVMYQVVFFQAGVGLLSSGPMPPGGTRCFRSSMWMMEGSLGNRDEVTQILWSLDGAFADGGGVGQADGLAARHEPLVLLR